MKYTKYIIILYDTYVIVTKCITLLYYVTSGTNDIVQRLLHTITLVYTILCYRGSSIVYIYIYTYIIRSEAPP